MWERVILLLISFTYINNKISVKGERKMEEKKTRGNKKILVVLAMLFLLIAIFAIGGYTFAKYITSTSAPSNQATAAKWGFVVSADTTGLFSEQYKQGNVVTSTETGVDVKVETAATNNLVAPGTKGSMTITIGGKAEVASKITFALKDKDGAAVTTKDIKLERAENTGAAVSAKSYAPVVWMVKKGANPLATAGSATTLAACLTAIETDINSLVTDGDTFIAPNTEITTTTYTLSWEWAFHTSDENDELDTIIGYAAMSAGTYGNYVVATGTDSVTVTDNRGTTVGATATDDDITYTVNKDIVFAIALTIEQVQAA